MATTTQPIPNGTNGLVSHNTPSKKSVNGHQDGLQDLSMRLSKSVSGYLGRLAAVGAPEPNLTDPFPDRVLDDEAQKAKHEILRTCERIMAMVSGPVEWGMYQNMGFVEPACMSAILELGIPELVGNGEASEKPTSLDELVDATGASKDILRRLMRVCTQRLFFEEVAPDQYVHNGCSLTLVVPTIRGLIGHCTDDGLRTSGKLVESLKKTNFQGSNDPAQTAFSDAFGIEKGMFDYFYNDDFERGARFGLGMAGSEVIKALTEDVYPFERLPPQAQVVDLGGGRGQVSVRLASKNPEMKFVVQDDEAILEAGQAEGVPEEVKDRITWMPHNFFDKQPVHGADVYLFRFILHDHPDQNCLNILRQVIDAMDPEKSRILVDDAVVPDLLGQDSLRFFNLLDIYMMMILNAKERTETQWYELFREVDERLVVEKIWREPGGGPQGGSVIELRLKH